MSFFPSNHSTLLRICALGAILLANHASLAFSVPGLTSSVASQHNHCHPRQNRLYDRSGINSICFSSLSHVVFDDDHGDGEDYAEFLDMKSRRLAIQNWTAFAGLSLDPLDVERMVQLMEKVQVDEGALLFRQGDKPDALYFVASGSFDCYDEATNSVKDTLGRFDIAGELGLLMEEPRALSVRAASPGSSVWRLNRSYFSQMVSREAKKTTMKNIEDQGMYSSFLEMRARRKALMSSTIFQNLSPNDISAVLECMKKIKVDDGHTAIREGDIGDAMYFVESGAFECFQEKDGTVLKVCEKGSCFGELAVFFATPRRLSVRATAPSAVWELNRDDLFAAVQEAAIDEEALEVIRTAYERRNVSINLDELYQLLVMKSRPKKKPVSVHSTISIVATGAYVASILPVLQPHTDPATGIFLFSRAIAPLSPEASHQMEFAVWSLAVSGVMGLFRFPPNTPASRKRMFEYAAASLFYAAIYNSSSLTGQPPDCWWIDAFSLPGRAALTLALVVPFISACRLLDDAIAGSMTGRESIPGADNRVAALVLYIFLYSLTVVNMLVLLPSFTSDAASFQANVADVFEANGYSGLVQIRSTLTAGSASFGALLATLQFEKKISTLVGFILAVSIMVTLNFDGVFFFYTLVTNPDACPKGAPGAVGWVFEEAFQVHFFEATAVCTTAVVLNAFRKTMLVGTANDDGVRGD